MSAHPLRPVLFPILTIVAMLGCGTGPTGPISQGVAVLKGNAGIDGETWLVSFDQAKVLAEMTGRPILADFTGSDWCGYCIALDEQVFASDEFKDWARQQVVLLKVDFPRNRTLPAPQARQNGVLAMSYGVSGYPSVLLLDATGKRLMKTGYNGLAPDAWCADIDRKLGPMLRASGRSASGRSPLPAVATIPAAQLPCDLAAPCERNVDATAFGASTRDAARLPEIITF